NDPAEIVIYPKNFAAKTSITKLIDRYNDRVRAAGQKDRVIAYNDIVGTMMSSVTKIVNAISYVLIAFVSISLIVSSIMIGVITYISVLERRKEIGILRAIGASKRNVSSVFNAETFIIGALAGLMGVAITGLLLIPVNLVIGRVTSGAAIHASLPPLAALVLILLSTGLTLLGGLIPAQKASKSDPVTALRTE
ncbi:ABC transporter permease, partial [uncultured Eubacterium sp.]